MAVLVFQVNEMDASLLVVEGLDGRNDASSIAARGEHACARHASALRGAGYRRHCGYRRTMDLSCLPKVSNRASARRHFASVSYTTVSHGRSE